MTPSRPTCGRPRIEATLAGLKRRFEKSATHLLYRYRTDLGRAGVDLDELVQCGLEAAYHALKDDGVNDASSEGEWAAATKHANAVGHLRIKSRLVDFIAHADVARSSEPDLMAQAANTAGDQAARTEAANGVMVLLNDPKMGPIARVIVTAGGTLSATEIAQRTNLDRETISRRRAAAKKWWNF